MSTRWLSPFLLPLLVACVKPYPATDSGGSDSSTSPDALPGTDSSMPEALRIDSVDPASGSLMGGYGVDVYGAGFATGTTVTFGTSACSAPTVVSSTQVSCSAPAATGPSTVDVTVSRPDGQSDTLTDGFEYLDGINPTLPGWCIHQLPDPLVGVAGWTTPFAYGRVFATGLTDAPGAAPGLTGEIGFGATGSTPDATWMWSASTFNIDADAGSNDEHQATLTAATAGTYALAYRFSIDAGMSWLPCDVDGNDGSPGGYDTAAAAVLVIDSAPGGDPDWCNLQFPTALTVAAGDASSDVYGRVFEPGVTDAVGRGPGVIAEIGIGPDGSDPTTDLTGWSFAGAWFNVDDGVNNDEYVGAVLVPPTITPGSYDYAYRFSLDGGATFRYCDSDGNDGAGNLYDPAMAGDLTVP